MLNKKHLLFGSIIIIAGFAISCKMIHKASRKKESARFSPYELSDREAIERSSALALKNNWTLDFTYKILGKDYIFRDLAYSNTTKLVANEIDGEYAIIRNIKFDENDIVLDVGANVGMVSITIAKDNPGVKFYAFEPADINFKNLEYNIKINNTPNVYAINHGLGGKSEVLNFKVSAVNSGGSSAFFYQNDNSNLFFEQKIQVHPISKFISDKKIGKIKLLKIDCEGCEFDVFENMSEETMKNIEYILAEAHCLNKNDEIRWNNIVEKLEKYIDKSKISYTSPHPDFCQKK
jgi:FkbM family methyltransferase